MTVMAILQDADKCMRCNGCVTACKREWSLKLPTSMADVKPQKSIVNPRQRVAIKSLKRGDMGPFLRFSCWHCPDPPCAYECPFGAIRKEATGAISVDNSKCNPNLCKTGPGPKPCETGCQRGGYPKVGVAYETGTYAGQLKMNKCTLCTGRAGADGVVDASTALPTRALKDTNPASPTFGQFISTLPLPSGGTLPFPAVPELAHEPACVSTCPAKAMKWDSKENILAYLRDPANGFTLANGTQNWIGNGAMFWASKKVMLTPPKADPLIEDHIAPVSVSMLSGTGMIVPTLIVGGLAALGARKVKLASEDRIVIEEEV
jgi:Fe-S-cluster-containing dehydrogenase component